jgi:outer membrane murein-binding lipoprotein Lpp
MKKASKVLLLPAAAAVLAALPLAGCQQGKHEEKKEPATEQVCAKADSMKEDTMEAFYERMRRYRALYPDVPLDK